MQVVHPFPVIVVVLTSALMLSVISIETPGSWIYARVVLTVLLSQISVGALNDYVDRHDDTRMQPDKPIPRGVISASAARNLSGASLLCLIPFSLTFGWVPTMWVLLGTGAGLLYDFGLKRTPWSVVAYIAGFLSLFTWICSIAGRFSSWFIVAYFLAPLLISAAHLAQSLPDIETDRELGHRGLAVVLGYARTTAVVLWLYFATVLVAVVGAVLQRSYMALLLATGSLILWACSVATSRRPMSDRRARVRLFRLVSPGLALAAVSSLLTLASAK